MNWIFAHLGKPKQYKTTFLTFLILTFCFSASCQRMVSPQAQSAIELFKNKMYTAAQPEFEKLASKYPKDLLYQFYLGACMVENNVSISQATSYLKNAAEKNINPQVWGYLGKAYFVQYRFNEANQAFTEMKTRSNFLENKNMGTNIELEKVARAQNFFNSALPLEYIEKRVVRDDSLIACLKNFANFIVLKVDVFNGKRDSVCIFGENNLEDETDYYFALQTSVTNSNKDIYKVRHQKGNQWHEPEKLGSVINSTLIEDFPVFDKKTHTLYFASNNSGVGGFNIFKSQYDSKTDNFSSPQLLPFAINSVLNDFIYSSTGNRKILVTDRDCRTGYMSVSLIYQPKNNDTLKITNSQELLNFSLLKLRNNKLKPTVEDNIFYVNNTKETSTVVNVQNSNASITKLANLGLELQNQADSLLLKISKLKSQLANITDKEKKAQQYSEIVKFEKQNKKIQEQANNYYQQIILNSGLLTKGDSSSSSRTKLRKQFNIASDSPYSKANPYLTYTAYPDGIIYTIQLGVFSKQVDYDHFGGIEPIKIELLPDSKVVKYYAGIFFSFEEADSILVKVKEYGFKEAFVVAYLSNKKIPVDRAKDLENNFE